MHMGVFQAVGMPLSTLATYHVGCWAPLHAHCLRWCGDHTVVNLSMFGKLPCWLLASPVRGASSSISCRSAGMTLL
jgi:hypothetical protein